jgi:hypothetical protein
MGIKEDELILLEANEEKSLVWTATHCPHHDVRPVKNISDWLYVTLFNLGHTYSTGEDHKAAIPERLDL